MLELIQRMNGLLLAELPELRTRFQGMGETEAEGRRLLRGLMNMWDKPWLPKDFLVLQDTFLQAEREMKGMVDAEALEALVPEPRIVIWQGDITRLRVDAIVNAANSALLGCFVPGHECIDNAIHSAAGLQLRQACRKIMQNQGHPEPIGEVKITPAFNLPCKLVFHTVGPLIAGAVHGNDQSLLARCYASCLEAAAKLELTSLAFCCISTGEFRFPPAMAARIAVGTVKEHLNWQTWPKRVIFDVFQDQDLAIYRNLLA